MRHPSSTVMKKIWMLMAAMILLMVPVIGQAATYGFECITINNVINAATGNAQLFVEVTDPGSNKVSFRFLNNGPLASSITQIYFDDGSLIAGPSINNGSGVDFILPSSAGNLPGGNPIDFTETAGFTAEPDSPVAPNGVNPGEWVEIIFNLQSGKTYADTLAALALGLANPGDDVVGGLRIGIHVQAFGNGRSEAFVNGPPVVTPEPGTIMLLGSGLLVLVGYGRRRLKK